MLCTNCPIKLNGRARKNGFMVKDWRAWLASLPRDEKRKLMDDLDVSQSSLSRWISHERTPRPRRLYDLINFNPELRASIEAEFPDAFKQIEENIALHLPVQQYEAILKSLAFVAEAVSQQTLAHSVFVYMSEMLDPMVSGLVLFPALCVVDGDGQIHHLTAGDGYGTGMWKRTQEHEYLELGRDSLVGVAVTRCRMMLYPQMVSVDHRAFALSLGMIASAGAFPLWRRGKIAGALFVASVHAEFFSEPRCELCARYADLYALSLPDDRFYDPSRIALRAIREGIEQPENPGTSGCFC